MNFSMYRPPPMVNPPGNFPPRPLLAGPTMVQPDASRFMTNPSSAVPMFVLPPTGIAPPRPHQNFMSFQTSALAPDVHGGGMGVSSVPTMQEAQNYMAQPSSSYMSLNLNLPPPNMSSSHQQHFQDQQQQVYQQQPPSAATSNASAPNLSDHEVDPDQPLVDPQRTVLDFFNSDLHLEISKSGYEAKNITDPPGFCFCWAGVRATYGVCSGKVFYEVRIVENLKVDFGDDHVETEPHLLRVGWSMNHTSLQLGEEANSYGYGGTGRFSTNNTFGIYGKPFKLGDVVTAFLDLESKPPAISFAKNGNWLGVASPLYGYKVNSPEHALFPHILSKNCRFEVNFGQQRPWYPELINMGHMLIDYLPIHLRIRGSLPPRRKADCEMIMIVGLPGSGKTTWGQKMQKENPQKCYNIIGTDTLIDKMKVQGLSRRNNYHGRWDVLIQKATACLNKLFLIASKRRRNYILDQTNVYASARKRKMKPFVGFKRICAVVQPEDDELKRREWKRTFEDGKVVPEEAVLEMKFNYSMPESEDDYVDEVMWVELERSQAYQVVKQYREEATSKLPSRKRTVEADNEAQNETNKQKKLWENQQASGNDSRRHQQQSQQNFQGFQNVGSFKLEQDSSNDFKQEAQKTTNFKQETSELFQYQDQHHAQQQDNSNYNRQGHQMFPPVGVPPPSVPPQGRQPLNSYYPQSRQMESGLPGDNWNENLLANATDPSSVPDLSRPPPGVRGDFDRNMQAFQPPGQSQMGGGGQQQFSMDSGEYNQWQDQRQPSRLESSNYQDVDIRSMSYDYDRGDSDRRPPSLDQRQPGRFGPPPPTAGGGKVVPLMEIPNRRSRFDDFDEPRDDRFRRDRNHGDRGSDGRGSGREDDDWKREKDRPPPRGGYHDRGRGGDDRWRGRSNKSPDRGYNSGSSRSRREGGRDEETKRWSGDSRDQKSNSRGRSPPRSDRPPVRESRWEDNKRSSNGAASSGRAAEQNRTQQPKSLLGDSPQQPPPPKDPGQNFSSSPQKQTPPGGNNSGQMPPTARFPGPRPSQAPPPLRGPRPMPPRVPPPSLAFGGPRFF